MNIAVVMAGGVGSRMGLDIPKQFLTVYDKPIFIYTLEIFQNNPNIDAIEVVCIDEWQGIVRSYAKQFKITKLKWVVAGGNTVSESIRNGIYNLEKECKDDDIVIIHDSVRPLLKQEVLSNVIAICKEKGNAIASLPCFEHVAITQDNGVSTTESLPKETCRLILTPQAYKFSLVDNAYHKAFDTDAGIHGSAYTNSMMTDLGIRLYFAHDSRDNLKLTTFDDISMFKSILAQHAIEDNEK